MALNGIFCVNVLLRTYSAAHLRTEWNSIIRSRTQ